ncbi:leucine-rich repeat neuronal protein 4 [Polymixia lowei]
MNAMMTASRDPSLPLVIVFLALLRGCASFATPSQVHGTNPTGPLRPRMSANEGSELLSEDYDTLYDKTSATTSPSPVFLGNQLCRYDVCLEMQPPCAKLAASTGCLCPGISLDNVVPEAPAVKRVSREGSEVVVWWCAPYSSVSSYKVMVAGQERQEFGEDRRHGTVGEVDHGTEVCVVAVNDAGVSKGSCITYQSTDNNVPLKAGLIGGALGFLLLFSLAVLLWRHRMRRKLAARISTQAGDSQRTELEDRAGPGVL